MRNPVLSGILVAAFCLAFPLLISVSEGKRAFRNIFHNYTFTVNEVYTAMNMTIEQNPSRFDMFVHVKRKLATFFWVTTLDIITTQGRVYPSFFYRSLDMCHYFANPSMDVIFALIYGELSRSGRWLKKCPVEKGVYAVQNFSLNTELFPTYTPELKYNITIQILHAPDARNAAQKIELVKVHVFGKMDSTNDVKRRRQKIGKRTKIPPEHPIKPNAFLISSKVVQPITTK